MNLLQETIEELQDHLKEPEDVLWVGNTYEYSISWSEFEKIANIEYNDGVGHLEIYEDLIVVGEGFWLERHYESNGSEWWEYKTFPKQPKNPKKFDSVKTKKDRYLTSIYARICKLSD